MKRLFTSTRNIIASCLLMIGFGTFAHAQVTVVATAGNPGPVIYPTVNDAFIAINNGTHQGDIAVAIMANTTEVGPCVLNGSGAGAAIYTSVTIGPGVDGVSISGPTTTGRGLIELNGADNVLIDGDNPNTAGVNRDLTIQNTAVNTTTFTSAIRIAVSTLITTADNCIIRNVNVRGSATGRNIPTATSTLNSEGNTFGILVAGGASSTLNTDPPNAITTTNTTTGGGTTAVGLTISNNDIDACARGIQINGNTTAFCPVLTVSDNIIGNATPASTTTVYCMGISASGFTSGFITSNTVRNIEWYVSSANVGINIGEASANSTGLAIRQNMVGPIVNRNTGTYGAYGINLAAGTNQFVANNFVSGMRHDMSGGGAFSTTFGVHGIRVGAGTGHTITYNSVNLYGANLGTPASSLLSSALTIVSTSSTGMTVTNNILANNLTGGTTNNAHVSMYLPTGGTSAMNLTLNNNTYYCGTSTTTAGILQRSTTYSAANLYLPGNFIQASTTPATNSRSYTSTLSAAGTNDNASWAYSVAPPYTSNADLHINIAAANVTDVDSRAVANSVTTDIDGDARPAMADIGADEFTLPNCVAASGGTISPSTQSICTGLTVVMTSTGATVANGISYQWMVGTTSGGPYVNVSGGIGATTTSYTTGVLTTGVYYYVLQTTCSFGPLTGLSNELTVTVNALPAIAVSPTSATFCTGGPGVSLTASGSSITYNWGPAAGLSATTGVNVTASPTVTTTYTVTGTDVNGCTASATTAITSAPGITGAAAVATPTAVCAGSPVNLNATSNGVPAVILAENFNAGAPTWTRINTSTGGTPANAAWTDRVSPYVYAAGTYSSNDASGFVMTNSDAQGSGSTTRTQLISPAFSTVGHNTININFYHYYRDIGDNGDSAVIEASLDNITWTRITQYTATAGTSSGFVNANVVLPPAYDNQASVYVRFRYIATWDWYWCVDNVVISGNTNSTLTFAWNASPAGFTSTLQSPTDNPTVTTTYSVVMTSPDGCTAGASVPVTVNPLPTVTASVSDDSTCLNDQVTFNGGGATSYSWTGGVIDNTPYTNAAVGSFSYTVTGTDANGCTDTASVTVVVNSLPTVTLSGSNTICAGDTAVLTGSGGGTSQWYLNGVAIVGATSNTYNATTAGVYNMTKTNLNGCSDSAAVGITVVVNALPTVTASATPTTVCAGDMVTASGSGASTYTWTGGIMDGVPFAAMSTMTYTVTGTDANGCEDTATVAVTVNPLPTVGAMSSDTITCLNDMVTFMGMGAATYTWNNGVTDMMPYMVTVSDMFVVTGTDANGCMGMDSILITVNPLPTVTASATDSSVCVGDQITFMGGGATTYAWDNGVTDMVPYTVSGSGTFIVTGTDANGCMDTASLVINATALPNVTLSLPLDTACLLLGPVTLGGESPAGGTWSGPGVSGNTFDPGVAGNGMHAIMYTYMDSVTGCSATAIDSMLVDICNSIDNNNVGNAVIYPNPNNGDFTLIPAGSGLVDVYVYSATGQLVIAEKATAGQPHNVKLEASGMYSVVIVTADGFRTTQRVVVNR